MPSHHRIVHVETTLEGAAARVRAWAKRLVDARLAACANVVGPVESVFRWKGRLTHAREWLVIFKTTRRGATRLLTEVERSHPYEVPYIGTFEGDTNAAYAGWVKGEVAERTRTGPGRPRPRAGR